MLYDTVISGVGEAGLSTLDNSRPLSLMAELPLGARFRHQAHLSQVSPEIAVCRHHGLHQGPDRGGGRAGGETTKGLRAGLCSAGQMQAPGGLYLTVSPGVTVIAYCGHLLGTAKWAQGQSEHDDHRQDAD